MANRIETGNGWLDVSSSLMNFAGARSVENGTSVKDELCNVIQGEYKDYETEDSEESDE